MKYNAISSTSLNAEGKKSTLTIYADLDIGDKHKETTMETEVATLKEDLMKAQTALTKQTRRCRQLVEEFTRRLQEKEYQYEYEKTLRDDQLAKVLRALLLVEARLKQEQKLITHQLQEKDFVIRKQNNEIIKLLSGQYCRNCSQYYSGQNLESLDSSSEYMMTNYQESNFGSLDSSSELFATLSDKDSSSNKSSPLDDSASVETKSDDVSHPSLFQKNKGYDSMGRKFRKFPHRKSVGSYFEVLKLHNDTVSPYSNEDNTSNDYDNFDSLPTESLADGISIISQESGNSADHPSLEKIDTVSNNFHDSETTNLSLSESNITVIHNTNTKNSNLFKDMVELNKEVNAELEENHRNSFLENKLSDTVQVFDVEGESNDKWYVSASDQEDEQQKNIYRNNPVLECVNQILLQNISDSLNSPPKTPHVERKLTKNKRVKFNDENTLIREEQVLTEKNLTVNDKNNENHSYYETPIQKVPNFYETPQSIYSNDYEQILSKCVETFPSPSNISLENKRDVMGHIQNQNIFVRKNKILRSPPALPPKPANLASKYRIQNNSQIILHENSSDAISLDSEPDYCSISELNLPTNRINSNKIEVKADINIYTPKDTSKDIDDTEQKLTKAPNEKSDSNDIDFTVDKKSEMIIKPIEKVNIQIAKQTIISSEDSDSSPKTHHICKTIPKLPLVTEIIIPEENEKEREDMFTQDNYVKNNSQMLKTKTPNVKRTPISIGSSVSSLIMGFNNRELMYELNKKQSAKSSPKKICSSLDDLPNLGKPVGPKVEYNYPNQEEFNLNQNFEEFKLDDCEIEEYSVDIMDSEEVMKEHQENSKAPLPTTDQNINAALSKKDKGQPDNVFIPTLKRKSVELFKHQLRKEKIGTPYLIEDTYKRNHEPTYEHFLECTGLSSKSILTPPRVPSNHKTVLKPKDVKLRSKTKGTHFDSSSKKYSSDPFV